MSQYYLTVRRVEKEDYQVPVEADSAMQAYDEIQKLVEARNKTSTIGKYSIVKVEREESHG